MTLSSSIHLPFDTSEPKGVAKMDLDAQRAALQAELTSVRAQLRDKSAEANRLRALLHERQASPDRLARDQTNHERRLQTILDRMPGAVAYWDANLILRFGNSRLMRHWADKPQPLLGQHMSRVLSAKGYERTLPFVREALAGRESSGEHHESDGLTAHVSYTPDIEDGLVRGFIVMALDVSELKAAQDAAEQASRAKSEFLASMSHEIRTPLNAVLGFAQVGAMRFEGHESNPHFTHILHAGQHLLSLINDVLDFSKIEAGKLNLQPGEMVLDDCIEQALELVREQAQSKGLRLVVERASGAPSRWQADTLRVGQILINLLTNAVKFTQRGEVRLSAWGDAQGLHLAVQDTGPGMAQPLLARLFEPFEQGDGGSSRRVGGTGLGLSISKRLAQLMGGHIAVRSAEGVGSRFEVVLPLPVVVPVAPIVSDVKQTDWHAFGLEGLNVLVAEDHHVNQLLLEQFLSNVGAVMTCVDNGLEAVEAVRAAGPGVFDLMLCDIDMPVMDGYQATEHIMQLDPGLPVLGLTAHAFDDARARGLKAGMVDYITKPYVYEELMKGMARHARRP